MNNDGWKVHYRRVLCMGDYITVTRKPKEPKLLVCDHRTKMGLYSA